MRINIKSLSFFLFGLFAYFVALGSIFYLIFFIGNFLVPITIDGPPRVGTLEALLNNLFLILLFAAQHTLMARQGFKKWWTSIIPRELQRSIYVLLSGVALNLLFYFWQPMGGLIWQVSHEPFVVAIYCLFFLGWSMMVLATFLINHWDLFGMRHVYLYLMGRPYTALNMSTPFLYKRVRHPLYLGLLIGFWASPTMTVTHLIFSITMTVYILIGIKYEEKDLVADFREKYVDYRKKVPMLLPLIEQKLKS